MEKKSPDELSRDEKRIVAEASKVMENAYAPYSGVKVGAAILTASGHIYRGVNVENSAYGDTICAERGALMSAYAHGHRDIEMIAIVMEPLENVASPCGSCRQMLYEASQVCGKDFEVIMASQEGYLVARISELLPLGFTLSRKE